MPILRLELLGPLRLVSPSGEILSASPLPLALLAFLAVEDRPFSRNHLADLFWPGGDRSRRLHNLRQTILRLKTPDTPDLIGGDGMVHLRPSILETDVELFKSHLTDGRVMEAVTLWRGCFLENFRRPQSWELEDWVDRNRSLLEVTLAAAAVKGAQDALDAEAPERALALLRTPRSVLPDHQRLGGMEVIALAGLGRRAEAEGVLKTLQISEVEVEEEVLAALESTPEMPPESQNTVPDSTTNEKVEEVAASSPVPALSRARSVPRPRPRRVRLLLWLASSAALLTLAGFALRWGSARAPISASDAAGYRIIVCTSWAADGLLNQPFRMKFDGTEKHRLSSEGICEGAWIEEVHALLGAASHREPDARLVRLDPDPSNSIAEWGLSEVETARDLRAVRISRSTPRVGPGGVLVFSAESGEGNRDVYALDPLSMTVLRLTDSPEVDDWPTVAQDGHRVIFTSFRTGAGDLYSVELGGGGLKRLTADPIQDGAARIHGDSVVFVRGRGTGAEDGNMELILLDLSTGEETQLTDNAWNDFEQTWSFDGRFLCWQSERLGHFESDIMVMDLLTGKQWNAIGTPGRESDCRWTPLGNGLLYLRFENATGSELYHSSMRGVRPVNISRYEGSEAVLGFLVLPEGMR